MTANVSFVLIPAVLSLENTSRNDNLMHALLYYLSVQVFRGKTFKIHLSLVQPIRKN